MTAFLPSRSARVAFAALAIAATSCSTMSNLAGDVTGSTEKKQAEEKAARAQTEVMSLADTFVGEMLDASGQIRAVTSDQRLAVLGWQIRQATAAYEIASSANPLEAAVDMAILVTLGRSTLEAWWIPKVFGETARPMLSVYAGLEPRAWAIVGQFTKPDQEVKLRSLVANWIPAHPELHDVASVRFADVYAFSSKSGLALGTPTQVLQSFGLDPFGGIDPAVEEVQRTRILAERAIYYAKRQPRLIELEVRQLAFHLAQQPPADRLLEEIGRASRAAESVARTASDLPTLVDREREASIRQVLDALASQEVRARSLLAEVRQTLDAGGSAAKALHGALTEFDVVYGRLNAPSPAPPPSTPPSPPFDIDSYTTALEQLRRSAEEIRALLRDVNQDAPRVAAFLGGAGREAEARGRALVDYALHRALVLGAALVGFVVAGAIAYRWVSSRIGSRKGPRGEGRDAVT
jgi:hypothetical protein